jgi:hypothetical protein
MEFCVLFRQRFWVEVGMMIMMMMLESRKRRSGSTDNDTKFC